MRERRAAVEAEAGDAQHGELDRQHVALLAARKVAGRLVDGRRLAVRESGGVEARRLLASLSYQRQIVFFGFMLTAPSLR